MFRWKLAIAATAAALTNNAAIAQSQDFCSAPLEQKAYDRTSKSINSELMFSAKAQLCNREYNNIQEAQNAARQSGFTLGLGTYNIGGSKAKITSTKRVNISETNFCKASATDLSQSFGSDFETVTASIAVQSWLECVKTSKENILYLDYTPSPDKQYFTGTLRVTANTGTLNRKIVGLVVAGSAKNTVSCNIGGRVIGYDDQNVPLEIEVLSTGTAIACEKNSDLGGVSIAFQTSAGATQYVDLPSQQSQELAEWDSLRLQMKAMWRHINGAVIPFNAKECPVGWEEYKKAYGRFVRGLDRSGDQIDPKTGRKAGDIQKDALQRHSHKIETVNTRSHDVTGPTQGFAYGPKGSPVTETSGVQDAQTATETRPKNVALLYCERVAN